MRHFFRKFRGFWYRFLGNFPGYDHGKRQTGYERRWNLETNGFTKEGFFEILKSNLLKDNPGGLVWELAAGDGRVGSLGLWLESEGKEWRVQAWEHRPAVADSFAKHRPSALLFRGRRVAMNLKEDASNLSVVTIRDSREASGLWKEIQSGRITPRLVGVWNPTCRPVWYHRFLRCGYRLELVYGRMEFYRRKIL